MGATTSSTQQQGSQGRQPSSSWTDVFFPECSPRPNVGKNGVGGSGRRRFERHETTRNGGSVISDFSARLGDGSSSGVDVDGVLKPRMNRLVKARSVNKIEKRAELDANTINFGGDEKIGGRCLGWAARKSD